MLRPKKSIEKMTGYFVPMYEKDWDIKIDSNENNYGPSPKVIEKLSKCNYKNISFYPFYGELSQKIANFNNVKIDNIKVTNGADEAIQAIIQTYLEPGESLLTLDVSFEMPVIYVQIQGGNIIKVPFKDKWKFPLDDFINKLKEQKESIKIIYLASPNNPTGNLIEETDLNIILENAKDKVVLIDETYANYAGKSYKKYIDKFNNIFIVRSFSKDFALAGMRLGYIISNTENIINLKKVVSPFSVNSYAMIAGITALEDVEYFERIKAEINESKLALKTFLESLNATVYDSYANFLLVDFKNKADFVYNKLKNANISVKLFKKDSLLENHLRITIPTIEGIKRIKEALRIKPSLVFDMDGVLIDASNSYRTAIEKTYEHFTGKTISQKEIQDAKNLGGLNNDWDLTQYLLKKSGYTIAYDEIVNVFQEIYWKNGNGLIKNETALFNIKLLSELSKNYNLSIFTGRPKKEALFALDKFNATNYFYPIITTDEIPQGMEKPNPYGLNIVKDVTIGETYTYFGDTTDDILAAKSAGYKAIGVLPPQDKSQELIEFLKKKGADNIINSITDIKTILEKKDEAVC